MSPQADQRGKLVVITGPSGVGKSTIVREVLRRTGARYSISATTRPPRAGEVDGRDYVFVDRPTFEEMIRRDKLLEWAEVFDALYGTPADAVQQALADGDNVILEIDAQGGVQVHQKRPEATFILIVPPSADELARRLRGRRTESEGALQKRLGAANREIQTARRSGVYQHEVVNDDLDSAVERIVRIITQESSKQ